jgi:2Fe-2S ferredoxin
MPKVTFVEFNGTEHHTDAEAGQSVMQVAINNLVPGIIAECGGNCSCATCHVYIEEPWSSLITAPTQQELEMVDCALHVTKASRLSCQVQITPALDGLVVRLPESQT